MILDAEDLDPGSRLTADVCILGAGAAGITLARDLEGTGLQVVVLESGAEALEPDFFEPIEGELSLLSRSHHSVDVERFGDDL